MTYQDPSGIFWRKNETGSWEHFNGSEWATADGSPPGYVEEPPAEPASPVDATRAPATAPEDATPSVTPIGRRARWPWAIGAALLLAGGAAGGAIAATSSHHPSHTANSANTLGSTLPVPTTTFVLPTTTTTTTIPVAQYEAACTNSPSYGQLTSPNAQSGLCVTYQAQVFQYDSRTGANAMLVEVTNDGYGFWSDIVELQLPPSVVAENLVQNDIIQFWGTTAGTDTYTTSIGGSNTVPVVDVAYANFVSSGG